MLTSNVRSQDTQDCVVEELTFRVTSERVAEFIRHDADIWTAALSKQPGFLGKQVWTSDDRPNEVRLIIRWRTRRDWNSVPEELLQETEREFKAAMGGDGDYELRSANAIDQRWVPPQSPGSQVVRLAAKDKGWQARAQEIVVDFDLVYRQTKRYRAVALREFLQTCFDLRRIEAGRAQLVFECRDGYRSPMPFSEAIVADGWIAIEDLEAPDGEKWIAVGEKSPAPYYVVWRGLKRGKAGTFPWPYAVESVRLVEQDEFYEAAFPGHATHATVGYFAYRKHCLHCHAINGAGGRLGVELNSPRSVTEYWKPAELREFIVNPSAFRHGSKMPSMKHLPANELDAVLVYLREMASNKK